MMMILIISFYMMIMMPPWFKLTGFQASNSSRGSAQQRDQTCHNNDIDIDDDDKKYVDDGMLRLNMLCTLTTSLTHLKKWIASTKMCWG